MKRKTLMCVAIQCGRLHKFNFQLLGMISTYSIEMEIIQKSFWKILKKSFKIKSRSCNQSGVILPSLVQKGQQEGMLNSLSAMLPLSSLMEKFYHSVMCPSEVCALHFPWQLGPETSDITNHFYNTGIMTQTGYGFISERQLCRQGLYKYICGIKLFIDNIFITLLYSTCNTRPQE